MGPRYSDTYEGEWPYGHRIVLVDLPDTGYGRSVAEKLSKYGWEAVLVSRDGEEAPSPEYGVAALVTDRWESATVIKEFFPSVRTVLLVADGEQPTDIRWEDVDQIMSWSAPVFRPAEWGPLNTAWMA